MDNNTPATALTLTLVGGMGVFTRSTCTTKPSGSSGGTSTAATSIPSGTCLTQPLPSSNSNAIQTRYTDDYFRVVQPANQPVFLSLVWPDGYRVWNHVDLDLYVYDDTTHLVLASSQTPGAEALTLGATSAERTLLVRVRLTSGVGTEYTLTIVTLPAGGASSSSGGSGSSSGTGGSNGVASSTGTGSSRTVAPPALPGEDYFLVTQAAHAELTVATFVEGPASSSRGASSSGGPSSSYTAFHGGPCIEDCLEPNNRPQDAAPVRFPSFEGWLDLTVCAAQDPVPANALDLYLLDPITLEVLAASIGAGPADHVSLQAVEAQRDVLVQVHPTGGTTTRYRLETANWAVCHIGNDPREPNETSSNATAVNVASGAVQLNAELCPQDVDWYTFTVPALARGNVELVLPPGDTLPGLSMNLFDHEGTHVGQAVYYNRAVRIELDAERAPRTFSLKVGPWSWQSYVLNFDFSLVAATPVDQCSGAQDLVAGTVVQGDTRGSVNDLRLAGGGCMADHAGPDDFYRASVSPGQTLTATVVPTSTADTTDLALVLLSSCSDWCCWASADNAANGGSETMMYQNTTGSPQTLVLVVDTFSSAEHAGPYELRVDIQ